MKKIYPDSSNGIATVTPVNCKPITEQQYEELVERTNCAEAKADTAITCTNNLSTSLQTGLTTCTVEATSINGQEASIDNVTATCVESDTVEANNVNTTCLTSDYATADCASVNSLNATSACIGTLETGSFNPGMICTNDITARYINASTVSSCCCINSPLICGSNACVSFVNSGNICNIYHLCNRCNVCIGGKTCLCGDVKANTINNKLSNTTCIDTRFIEHTYCQVFTGSNSDKFTVLPLFTNGYYYLEARTDGGIKLFSIEVSNSQGNLMYRWSQKAIDYLKYVKAGSFDDGYTGKYEISWNGRGQRINLYYQSSSTDNVAAPTTYGISQITDDYRQHDITDVNGTYVDDLMVTDTLRVEKLEMNELAMDNVSVYKNLGLTACVVDCNPVTTTGENLDYVQVTSCADGVTLRPSWQHPANCNTPTGFSNTSTCLVTEKSVANYNGISTDGTNDCYNIAHLGNNTCTHGNHIVECTLTAKDASVTCTLTSPHFTDGGTISNGLDIQALTTQIPVYCPDFVTRELTTTNCYCYCADVQGPTWFWQLDTSSISGCYVPYTYEGSMDITWIKLCELSNPMITTTWYQGYPGFCYRSHFYDDNGYVAWQCLPLSYHFAPVDLTEGYCSFPAYYESHETIDCGAVINRKKENRCDTVAAYKCECNWTNVSNTTPLSYDSVTDTIQPTDTIEVTNATIGNLTVSADAHINGNLYVEGKTVTQESETISTGADAIVLRQNKASGLSNTEISGVIVHNYDGNDNNTIVGIDNTGTVRVGDATGSDTTYAEIWLDVNGDWYDTDGTTPITVTGELTKYDSKVVDGDFTKYTNAVFTVFTLTELEPVATRAEVSAMNDHALTCWDATNKEIHTITAPTEADQTLVSCANGDNTYGYRWQNNYSDSCKVFRFESMACYNAYTGTIPTGSIVYIDNEDNWIKSEEM